MKSSCQTRWTGSNDSHSLPFCLSRCNDMILLPVQCCCISDKAFETINGNRCIKMTAVTLHFAGTGTDPTHRTRQGNFLLDHTKCFFIMTLSNELNISSNIYASWAG